MFEACEQKEHFLKYESNIVLINNIDYDHVDYYKKEEDKVTLSKEAYLDLLTAEKGNKTVVVKNIDYAWSVISTVIGLFATVWGWGAFNAYKDVEAKTPLLVVMAKAYGPTYNPITRHGYRMYIKHFTTMEGVEDNRKESDRYKDVVEETIYDLKNGLGL